MYTRLPVCVLYVPLTRHCGVRVYRKRYGVLVCEDHWTPSTLRSFWVPLMSHSYNVGTDPPLLLLGFSVWKVIFVLNKFCVFLQLHKVFRGWLVPWNNIERLTTMNPTFSLVFRFPFSVYVKNNESHEWVVIGFCLITVWHVNEMVPLLYLVHSIKTHRKDDNTILVSHMRTCSIFFHVQHIDVIKISTQFTCSVLYLYFSF